MKKKKNLRKIFYMVFILSFSLCFFNNLQIAFSGNLEKSGGSDAGSGNLVSTGEVYQPPLHKIVLYIVRDPAWQFVFGLLAITVAFLIFIMQRKRKAISYDIIASIPILGIEDKIKSKLQILYDGTPVTNPYAISVMIRNSGNVSVVPEDFIEPIRMVFSDKVQILGAEATSLVKNLMATLKFENGNIELVPLLLNRNDDVIIKAIVANYDDKFEVRGRIVGIKNISSSREKGERLASLFINIGGVLFLVFGIFADSPFLAVFGSIMIIASAFASSDARENARQSVKRLITTILKDN